MSSIGNFIFNFWSALSSFQQKKGISSTNIKVCSHGALTFNFIREEEILVDCLSSFKSDSWSRNHRPKVLIEPVTGRLRSSQSGNEENQVFLAFSVSSARLASRSRGPSSALAGNLIDVRTDLKLDEQQTRQSISSVGESFRGILFHMLNKGK